MEINYYRHPSAQGEQESWLSCQFTHKTDLSSFMQPKTLVEINGQPIVRQRHATYLTGKETCRAHHFAKLLATRVLTTPVETQNPASPTCGRVPYAATPVAAPQRQTQNPAPPTCGRVPYATTPVAAPQRQTQNPAPPTCGRVPYAATPVAAPQRQCPVGSGSAAVTSCKVLWIDTLHGPHVCTHIYQELVTHATSSEDLHFVCLDILGGQRDNFYAVSRNVEALIRDLKPQLVVIDDIDHFMPFCGVRIATEFCRIVRDVLNHTTTAFLFIGYNHLGKKAGTTGNLGKYLFTESNDIFSLSTQREVTTVRLVNSYDLSRCPDDTQFRFTIGDDNLPHEAERDPKTKKTTTR